MKKFMVGMTLSGIVIAGQLFAAEPITINASAVGNVVTITYDATGAAKMPVGFSMNITPAAGNVQVSAATDIDEGGDGHHDGYIDFKNSGTGTEHPIAKIGSAGAMTLPTAGSPFALCMGELDAANPMSIPATGTLAVIKFDKVNANTTDSITIGPDTSNRGGIVDQDGNAMTVTWPSPVTVNVDCCWNYPSQAKGDANGDGKANNADLLILRQQWLKSYGSPGYNCCANFSRSGSVNNQDLLILRANWLGTDLGGTYSNLQCLPGD